jgi:enediyne biosynthesis protein CalE5
VNSLVMRSVTSGPSQSDSDQFKIGQRRSWNNAAAGWQEWWKTFENAATVVSDKLVELAGITAGHQILDLATGTGEPALTAAKKIAESKGHVLATDISPQMLVIAKQRAAALGLQDRVEFRESDAEILEISGSSFDAILCRWGLMYFPHLDSTLTRIFDGLRSGGRFACAVWASPAKVPLISIPMGIVNRELIIPAPSPSVPGPFALADIGILESSMTKAGFKSIQTELVPVIFRFARVY